jgi:hypothetical protein
MSKCFECKRKITLAQQIAAQCKCEQSFCLAHRHANMHACTYINQFKLDDKKLLEKTLVKVEGEKLIKI